MVIVCHAQHQQYVFLCVLPTMGKIGNIFFYVFCPQWAISVICFSRVIVRCAQHRQCVFLGLVSAVRNTGNAFFSGYCSLWATSVMRFSRVGVRCAQHQQCVFLGLLSAVRGVHTFFVRTVPPAPERSEENVSKKNFLFYLSTVRGAITFFSSYCPLWATSVMRFSRVGVRCARGTYFFCANSTACA
jgi:hypothetical protein